MKFLNDIMQFLGEIQLTDKPVRFQSIEIVEADEKSDSEKLLMANYEFEIMKQGRYAEGEKCIKKK